MRTRLFAFFILSTVVFALSATAGDRFSYIFKRGDRQQMRVNGPIDSAIRFAKKWDGDYIWVKQDGREYLIRDAAVLAQASEAMRELDAFEPTMRDAERKMKPFEDRLEEIEDRADQLSDQLDDEDLLDSQRDAIEASLHEVEAQMRKVEERMHGLEEQMEDLERQMDAREEEAERKLEQIIEKAIRNGIAKRAE